MNKVRAALLLGSVAAVVACVPRREPPPPPAPQPRVQVPVPAPVPVPPPPRADWRDIPLTPGGWTYRADAQGSLAEFGAAGGRASFAVRCDRATRQVRLSRQGAGAGNMTIRTSYTARNLPLTGGAEPSASVPASDRLLDQMAFSRGRFTVEVPGTAMLVIPSWPEPARVVEDCRG